MTAEADRARAEVQAAVLGPARLWESLAEGNVAKTAGLRAFYQQRAADLRTALGDTAALDRMLAEARAEAWDEGFQQGERFGVSIAKDTLVAKTEDFTNPYRAEGEGATCD